MLYNYVIMESKQEELVNLFSHTLTGAAAVFAPDCYGFSGNKKTDEPADLVWNYEDFVLLMYMTRTEKKFEDQEVLAAKKQKQIDHNLKQAKKWLNHWRINKIPLRGKNDHQSFDISFTENLKVFVISIYEVGTNDGFIEIDFALKNKISMCVSLPESAIRLLADLEATPADICWIFTAIINIGVPSPFDSHAIILNHFRKDALQINELFTPINSSEISSCVKSIKDIKRSCSNLVRSSDGNSTFVRVFNDLLSIEIEMIINSIDNILLEHKQNYRMHKAVRIKLSHYCVLIIVCNSGYTGSKSVIKLAEADANKLDKDLLSITFCLYDDSGKYLIAAIFEQTRPSLISILLQSVIPNLEKYEILSDHFRNERIMLESLSKKL